MSGIKGMKKYPAEIRKTVVDRIRAGESQCKLSKAYGISRWAIAYYIIFPLQTSTSFQHQQEKHQT